mmetsp:Transcript_25008/g.58679  ORF Transcript_25008/g.58679 Transcript_25008/m.58679 type:complete len:118 (+) Transcript_25008:141-494(+)
MFTYSLQSILNNNYFWSCSNPTLNNRFEQVVCPFQVKNAKDCMNWDEEKFPEKVFPFDFDFFRPQMKEKDQQFRVEVTSNRKPSNVKKRGDSGSDGRGNFCVTTRAVTASINQTSTN